MAEGTTFERLKKLIVEQLGVDEDEVTPQASFVEDLNADSLDLVELIMSLEEEFGMEISDEDAEKIQKVSDAAAARIPDLIAEWTRTHPATSGIRGELRARIAHRLGRGERD